MAYVKTLYDFGGNKYDIKDAAAMKDVDLVGSDLSFYDGDNNLIKKVTLSGGAKKWTATFTQQYIDSNKRSMALTPSGFTIDDVKEGDIIVASDDNQYTDLPTGWLINWNQGSQAQVGILVVDNVATTNLYYPLGSEYQYMFIVNYIDKANNKVYLRMIPPHFKDRIDSVIPNTFASKTAAFAALAVYRPYYLIEDNSKSLINWPDSNGDSFDSFVNTVDSYTMLFDNNKYAQWLTITDGPDQYNMTFAYTPYIGRASAHDEAFLCKPDYIYKSGAESIYPIQTLQLAKGPDVSGNIARYDILQPYNAASFAMSLRTVLLFGKWY